MRSDIVICPWCDCQYPDPHDFPRSGDERCDRCGKKFRVDIEYTVTYTTSKIEEAQTP